MKYGFYANCVGWPEDAFIKGGLADMIDNSLTISRRTFMGHVNREDLATLELQLGYCRAWLLMSSDWHVEYFRSTLHGKRVYGFSHSAIEYVFTLAERH